MKFPEFSLLAGKSSLVWRDYTNRQQAIDITGVFVSVKRLALTSRNLASIWRGFEADSSGDRVFDAEKRDAFA